MNTVIKRAWNKNKLVKVEDLTGMTFQAESGGHTFEISGVDDTGAAVSLSGTVEARFLRADNAEIIISGAVSSGNASATLSAACYAIPGRFLLTVYVTSGGQKVAVYAATGSVVATSGTAGGSIPPLVTDSIIAGDVTVNGVLDVTNRRTNVVSLSASGWYRAIKIANSWRGGRSFAVDICIGRTYANSENEIHRITLLANWDSFAFVDEISKSDTNIISGIRYTHDSNNGYIDIQYLSLSSNNVYVDFDVHCSPTEMENFTAQSLQSVVDSPYGETVLTAYGFSADTETVGTVVGASGFTPDEIDVKRSGRVVYAHFFVRNVTIAANTHTEIGTLSGVPFPNNYIRWLAAGGVHAYDTMTPVYALLSPNGNISVISPSSISAVNITISYIV